MRSCRVYIIYSRDVLWAYKIFSSNSYEGTSIPGFSHKFSQKGVGSGLQLHSVEVTPHMRCPEAPYTLLGLFESPIRFCPPMNSSPVPRP